MQSNLGFTKVDDQKVRADRTRDMANYLWTNYIESVASGREINFADGCADPTTQHKSSSWG